MSISPTTPRPSDDGGSIPPTGSSQSKLPLVIVAIVMVIGLVGLFLYAKSLNDQLDQMKTSIDSTLSSQGETLQRLSQRLEANDAKTKDLQGNLSVTQNRLGSTQTEVQKARQTAAELAQQQLQSAQQARQMNSQLGQLQQDQVSTKGMVGNLSTTMTGVKGDVQTNTKELEATKSKLQSVIGDLGVQSGLVAHNQTELAALKLRGERDYVEFNLTKKQKRQRVGNIQIELKKTDTKRQKYTISLIADDKTIEKKDKTLDEPVQFYLRGYNAPSEIVVNQISKDRIVGYLSTPKKKESRTPMKAS